MNATVTKSEIRAYVAARHPQYKRDNKAGGWYQHGAGRGISDAEARREAEAEKEAWQDGLAKKPGWIK